MPININFKGSFVLSTEAVCGKEFGIVIPPDTSFSLTCHVFDE